MSQAATIRSCISKQKLIPLFYTAVPATAIAILEVLYNEGVRVIEFTHRGNNALQVFREMIAAKEARFPEMQLLVGTIFSPEQAELYMEAGADGLVSPCYTPELAAFANETDSFWIPGCMTPSEINTAASTGSEWIKLFPGNTLGPEFVKAIKPVFPSLHFMVTGGVDLELANLNGWFSAGVSAAGLGSNWISADIIKNAAMDTLLANTRKAMDLVNQLNQP